MIQSFAPIRMLKFDALKYHPPPSEITAYHVTPQRKGYITHDKYIYDGEKN